MKATRISKPKMLPMKLLNRSRYALAAEDPRPGPANNVAKIGTTFHSSSMMTPPATVKTRDRIHQRGFHGALQLDVLFDVGREALQNGVENTAGLAGFHHVHVQRIEDFCDAAPWRRKASRRLPPRPRVPVRTF